MMDVDAYIEALEPCFNWLLLRKVNEGEMSSGGIIIPTVDGMGDNSYMEYFEVLKVGPGVEDGHASPCEKGDMVLVSGPAIGIKGARSGECLMQWVHVVCKYSPKPGSSGKLTVVN